MGPPIKGDLSDSEKALIDAATKGNFTEVRAYLSEPGVRVDCLDETGMTPLQHAAFRNRQEICEYLLQHGAKVNSNEHENSYSTLMFAALSGSPRLTRLMLDAGAKKDHVNSVGRTAAQMAAFVGQHPCVAVINNFFAKEDIRYYTIPSGQEKEPKLPVPLLMPMTNLMNLSNMHPVKVSMYLHDNQPLLEDHKKVTRVLDIICEKAMKARDTADITAMKAHYFATVIRHSIKLYSKEKGLETWIKSMLKGREKDGYPEFQDRIIRQALQEFPYTDSQLLQNMVRQLSAVKIGDNPTSLNILMQGVNGQKFTFDEDEDCITCGEPKAIKKCSACKMVHYCDARCQKAHWFTHKKFCKALAVEYERLMEEKEKEKREELERQKEQETEKLAEKLAEVKVEGQVSESLENGTGAAAQEKGPEETAES